MTEEQVQGEAEVQKESTQVEAEVQAEESNPKSQFLEMLPEDFRKDPTFDKFKGVDDLAKSYKNLEKMVGADKNSVFKIPEDGDLSEVYNRLGRPESPDSYKSEALSDEKFSELIDGEKIEALKKVAHESGVTNEAFDKILGFYKDDVLSQIESSEKEFQQTMEQNADQIKKDLGEAYEERLGQIHQLQDKYGDDDLGQLVESNPHVFQSPAFVRFMAQIAPQFNEDGATKTADSGSSGRMTPAEAEMAIAKLEGRDDFMKIMRDKSNPQRKSLMQEREKLYRIKNAR